MNVLLLLVNEYGVEVGGGICRNSNPIDCIDKHALGDDDIEVLIIDPVECEPDFVPTIQFKTLKRLKH